MFGTVITWVVDADRQAVKVFRKHVLGKEDEPPTIKERAVNAVTKTLPEDEAYAVLRAAEEVPGMIKSAYKKMKKVKEFVWD